MKPIRKAVFPVAGLGTRFLPATKAVPKEMLPLVDRPLIQYAIDEARAAGIEEFIFVTSAGKSAIENYLGAMPALERTLIDANKTNALEALRPSQMTEGSFSFIRQDEPRGLGHAVSLAQRLVGDEPFAVILPDDIIRADTPALTQMVEAFDSNDGHMVATEEVPMQRLGSYGVVDIARSAGRLQSLRGLVEKPDPACAPSSFGIVGRYILQPSIFDQLAKGKPGSGGEIQLTDAIAQDMNTAPVSGFAFDGERFDCGSIAGFLCATFAHAFDRKELGEELHQFMKMRSSIPPVAA
ncbi:MAG: UTP--glucose-1-phosphate uridylyltransferase [Litoreibacter sp.]|uniref:UTP--glucose-1-phosphate uridylyltransferase n=1 Tax=Litoreibacter sp. TaxID=1969459 RepID=UPI00329875DE